MMILKYVNREKNIHPHRETSKQMDGQTDMQTDMQTDRQTDITVMSLCIFIVTVVMR